jgi:hypothetical protein
MRIDWNAIRASMTDATHYRNTDGSLTANGFKSGLAQWQSCDGSEDTLFDTGKQIYWADGKYHVKQFCAHEEVFYKTYTYLSAALKKYNKIRIKHTTMNIYRIHPGNDAFQINGVYLPYLDIIAENEAAALISVGMLVPGLDCDYSSNTLNYIELIGKH